MGHPRTAKWLLALALVTGMTGLSAAQAAEEVGAIPPALVDDLRRIVQQDVALISLRAQNEQNTGIAQERIDSLDRDWRTEADSPAQPLIAQLMGSPLSSYLIDIKARSLGLFVEIFVMDEHGLNVGQSSITSDYWQGDEDKYLKTFAVGPGAIHYGDVERDETFRIDKQQVSFPIADPKTGRLIGAATFEINLTELERRS